MARNGNPEEASNGAIKIAVSCPGEPSVAPVSPVPISSASRLAPLVARSASLRLRIVAGFAAMTLSMALMMAIITIRMFGDIGLSPEQAASIHQAFLICGFGAVIVAGLLGVIFARQISEPLRRLTDELRQGDFREDEMLGKLTQAMEGRLADVILSDMAPNLSGIHAADAAARSA